MKEWHVMVLEGHKRIYDKIFFNIADAKAKHKELQELYAQEIKDRKYLVIREYF